VLFAAVLFVLAYAGSEFKQNVARRASQRAANVANS